MLELIGISKSFGGEQVLQNFNLRVAKGEVACLMGASGVGKTTAVNIMLGLEKQDGGRVIIPQGAKVCAVFQENRLLAWRTARQNVAFVMQQRDEAKELELLSAVGLEHSADKLAADLSGGMQRRLCLAMALASQADYLLLDEPFAGLDDKAKYKLITLIKNYAQNAGVLVVTHSAEDAQALGARIETII